ncbi:MAG: ribonuclease HI family protein [Chloroflexota bacterium]
MRLSKVIINTDGACWGNPGPGAVGAILKDARGKVVASVSRAIGQTTNNQAEYRAVIAALETALGLGASIIELRSDSELLVRQIDGEYRVKNVSLKPLHQRVKDLQKQFSSFTIKHVPDEENSEAHNLASKALKKHSL